MTTTMPLLHNPFPHHRFPSLTHSSSPPSSGRMASSLNPIHGRRRLFELLQEQQEPFLSSDKELFSPTFLCWPGRKLTRFSPNGFERRRRNRRRRGRRRRRKGRGTNKLIHIKSLLNRLIKKASFFDVPKMKNDAAEFHRLRESELRSSNQLSPVSVLDQGASHYCEVEEEEEDEEHLPLSSSSMSFDSAKSAPWVDLGEKVKQLRFQQWTTGNQNENDGKEEEDLDFLSQLPEFDLSKSSGGWSHFEDERREVGSEIEHIIFEEIREETALEILTLER